MTDISVSAATRSSLLLAQRTADVRAETSERLSTGLRVRRPADAPAVFFEAQSARARVRDLLQAKDEISQAVSAVETAQTGAGAIEELAGQLKGLALSVQGASAEERQTAVEQFAVIRDQITALADDLSFGGVALISSTPGGLDVNLDGDGGADLTINAQASDAASLGIGSAAETYNNFTTDADIANAVSDLNAAVSSVRNFTASFANNLSVLRVREDFNETLSNTLDAGAAKLVDADLNREAARALAARVREQLAAEALRIGNGSQGVLASLI